MTLDSIDKTKLSPGMKQYVSFKEQNMDVILFFRLGDFYEMFFEDAITASRELELTLTSKSAGLDERVPMCGVPFHAANIYIEKLVEKGYKVAIAEQVEDPKKAKGIVKREVIQVVSKGTIMDEYSLDAGSNNYIASIIDMTHAYILTYADISTGLIESVLVAHNPTKLLNEVVGLNIKEVIVPNSFDRMVTNALSKDYGVIVTYYDSTTELEEYKYIYEDITDERYIMGVRLLLNYLNETLKRPLTHLLKLVIKDYDKYMKMDIHTKRNLELTETLRLKERQYSLLWLLDKTKTAPGSRMLRNYIENPLVDIETINKRYDIVETLLNEFILKSDLDTYLDSIYDLERLAGRIQFGNANARDLLQLKSSLKVLPNIKEILKQIHYKDIEDLSEVYDLLEKSIYEDAPISLKEGYLIKEGYNSELDELKTLRKGGKDFVAKFESLEREKTGIKTLKVGYNRVFGYYIEVSKGQVKDIKDEYGYERRQTLANSERYISPLLKEKEALILNAEEKIVELEYNLFVEIKDIVKKYIPRIQEIAKVISEIDVLSSFATVTEDNNYVRPTLVNENIIDIKDSRHPVVEKVLSCPFVPNDIYMDENTNILLITGPNMAGKSTFMRELAITAIMAQIGCFVPASEAKLKVFDAIYTRIGASDDLVSGSSTFMVEMSEANYALTNATKNSLVLFDELGRGTATYDGMALAYSIIEYIEKVGAKVLFSTHYHELTDLENKLKHLKNVHVSAYEENGNITFLHKICDGAIDKSYGIHVAKLANLPNEVIKKAEEVLKVYEKSDNKKSISIQEALPLDLIDKSSNEVIDKLKEIDIFKITPIDAMNILYELKDKIK